MKKKLMIIGALLFVLACIAVPGQVKAAQNGWVKDNGEWFYYENNVKVTGWKKINLTWYFFDESNGNMFSDGVWYIGDKAYYFNRSGAMKTGWIKEVMTYDDESSIVWYYANSNGALHSGWLKQKGEWYYFDEESHMMVVGGATLIDGGGLYVFKENGTLVKSSGWIKIDDDWYYTNSDGTAQTGWKHDGTAWCYLHEVWGFAVTGGHVIDGYLYSFDKDVHLISKIIKPGWFKDIGNFWYYVKSNGKPAIGWEKIKNKWYFFENENDPGYMIENDFYLTGGKVYFFNPGGALVSKEGWYKNWAGNWFYADKNGVCFTGWKKIKGKWYYFEPWTGIMYSDGTFWIDDVEYTFNSSGAWVNN